MLSKIEHDLDDSDVQGCDDLRVVYALMQIRLEFFYYNVLDGAEKTMFVKNYLEIVYSDT